jgi:hypothetical protein
MLHIRPLNIPSLVDTHQLVAIRGIIHIQPRELPDNLHLILSRLGVSVGVKGGVVANLYRASVSPVHLIQISRSAFWDAYHLVFAGRLSGRDEGATTAISSSVGNLPAFSAYSGGCEGVVSCYACFGVGDATAVHTGSK